jgi:hypothetical protein
VLVLASPLVAAERASVISYPAAFFATFQPNSALDMLGHVPGFIFDSGESVRGFADAAGNVLVDGGRPAAKDDNLGDILRRIPASSVLRIELIRGGAEGIDMQGKTVLANVIRRKDIGGKLTVNASTTHDLGDQASGNLLIEGEKRIGDISLDGSLRVAKYIDSGAGSGTWVRADATGTPFVLADEHSRGAGDGYKATGAIETPFMGGKLRFNASATSQPFGGDQTETLVPPPGVENDHYTFSQESLEFGVRYQRALGARWSLESFALQRVGRQSNTDDFLSDPETAARTGDDVSAAFYLKKNTAESIVRTRLTYQASRTLALDVGLEGDFNGLTSFTLYTENGVLTPLPAADVTVDEYRGEAFATARWQARSDLSIDAGLRIEASRIISAGDVISARDLYYPKPRLALAWSPEAADQFRLRMEREVGQLDFNDFTAQVAGLNTGTVHAGNPTLNPGEDWVIEGTWERRFGKTADFTATLRRYWLEDVVDRIGVASPSGVYDAPGNIGDGTRSEAEFQLSLPLDRLGIARGLLTGDAVFRQSDVTDPTTGLTRGISGLHQSDWSVHFSQALPRWKASWGVDVFGPWIQTFYRFDEIDTDKLGAFITPFAEYKPRADLTFKVELLSPFGQGLEHSREVFNGPRNLDGIDFIDVHHIHTGRFLRVRFIKSFS